MIYTHIVYANLCYSVLFAYVETLRDGDMTNWYSGTSFQLTFAPTALGEGVSEIKVNIDKTDHYI